MTIYDRIKDLANERGISIRELESQLHFSNGTMNKWRTSSPSIDKLQKVAEFFSVTIDYLIGRNQTPKDATKQETLALEKILQNDAGLTYTEEAVTPEDLAAIEGMIAAYFWSKGRNKIKKTDSTKE